MLKLLGLLHYISLSTWTGYGAYWHSWYLVFPGNISIEAAINWVAEHEDDPDIDQMPLVRFFPESCRLFAEFADFMFQWMRNTAICFNINLNSLRFIVLSFVWDKQL